MDISKLIKQLGEAAECLEQRSIDERNRFEKNRILRHAHAVKKAKERLEREQKESESNQPKSLF